MNDSIASKKSLFPALFHIGAHIDDSQSVLALKKALATGRRPLSEMMLDARKLEASLKSFARRKKSTA